MTLRPMGAALAVLATAALVVWVATRSGSAEPTAVRAPPADEESRVADDAPVLPAGAASDPQPVAALNMPDAPAAEPGFTVSVTARRRGPSGKPVAAGVETLELGIDRSRKELGDPVMTFQTGPDGTARPDVPRRLVPVREDGKPSTLWLRSRGPGLLTRTSHQLVPEADGATVAMNVEVLPGTIVEGLLVDADGQPVAGQVDWWHVTDTGGTTGRVGSAGADGRFRGELLHEGRHVLLGEGATRADADVGYGIFSREALDLGTGASAPFEVSFTEPVPFVELRVSGPGRIEGRVRDARGEPAVGVRLMTVLAELDDEVGSLRLPYPHTRELELLGGGHVWMTTRTDAQGAFAFRGLRHGRFHVRAADGEDTDGYPHLLTDPDVPSDGPSLHLVLDRTYLAIHVREVDGSVPELAFGRVFFGDRLVPGKAWPDEPQLVVMRSPRDAHLGRWWNETLEVSRVEPGEYVVALERELHEAPSLEVDLGVRGGDLPWRPRRVVVARGAGRVDVDLVLPPTATPGRLVLDVVDDAGAAVTRDVRVRVLDAELLLTLVDVGCSSTDAEDWPMHIPLPEGAYRLWIEGAPDLDFHHGTLSRRRRHGEYEAALYIAAGAEARVTAVLGPVARLAVRVIGETSDADRAAIPGWGRDDVADEYVEFWAKAVRLRLEREGRRPEWPQFARSAWEGTSAAGTHLFSSVDFGSEETSEALAPGTGTLVGTTAGGRSVRLPVTLLPGQTTSVTLRFD